MPARSAPGWQAAARRRRRSSSVSESWRTAVRRMASAIRRAWPRPRSASGSHGSWKKNMSQLRASWRRLVPRCCAKIAGCGQFITTSRGVASGCSMAKVQATAPPQSWPTITASRSPNASTSPRTSATSSGSAYAATPAGLSLRLWPRRSGATARKRGARAAIWCRHEYQHSGKPCSRTTSGPSPSIAQWRWMPLVATVRCSRAIAGRHSEGATALSNRMTGLSLPRAGRIMIGMAPRDRFLLCTPRFYRVEYVINPWMEGNVGRTDAEEAMRQWEALRAALAARADLELLGPAAGLPDMPFTANAGLVHEDTFVPARFRFPQRAPETRHAVEWFRRRGSRIVELPGRGTFEGEGDALFQPGAPLLWGGYGVRTSVEAHRHLAEMLDAEVVPLRLVDDPFHPLDTCFCPLPEGRVFYYRDAFDRESLDRIAARVPSEQRCEVDAADALHSACNAVVTGGAVITNFASDALRERMAGWGHEVVVCPLGQFILAGGAAKCLVLQLEPPGARRPARAPRVASEVRERAIEIQGDLLDTGLMNAMLDRITDGGGDFEIEAFQPGLRHDQASLARVRVLAPSPERLEAILAQLIQAGARTADEERDARLEPVEQDGVAPHDFYSTSIFPTDVRVRGRWVRAARQRMAALVAAAGRPGEPRVTR